MNLRPPQIPTELTLVDDFTAQAQFALAEEDILMEIECTEIHVESGVFPKLEVRNSVFLRCQFQDCDFSNASFVDVAFEDCDLANSRFTGAFFERCRFVSCKGIGVDMSETIVRQTSYEQTNFHYANFNRAKLTDIVFLEVDFTEASMSEAKLKQVVVTRSQWIRNVLFKTALTGIDFSDSEFAAPTVSTPPTELKGAIVNAFQAAELVRLWGVIVK